MAKKDNKEKNPVGRPLKYKTVKEMAEKIELYFDDPSEEPFTVTGLAIYLDLTKEGLWHYEQREEFFNTIKKAKEKIEDHINKMILTNKYNVTAGIFNLKNNFNWTDKQQIEHSGETTQNVNVMSEEDKKRKYEDLKKRMSDLND